MNPSPAISILLLISSIIFIQCKNTEKPTEKNVSQFNWLVGHWAMKEKDGIVTEQWKPVNDSLMEGSSDFIKGDSTIPFETIKLFRRSDGFYYEAKAAGQNKEQPVEFKLTSFSDTGFVAENPQHDFPKRITYRLVNKDSIHAFVDGGPGMPDKKSDFYYSKIKK
jgi:Domain of unknown function (DUF6265)